VTYTQSGVYGDTTLNGLCKDTAVLHLTITNGTRVDTTAAACGSFTWHGVTYTQSGVYGDTTLNGLCKDTAVLHLTIKQPTSSTTSITICQKQLPYTWNGQTYSSGGTYSVILTNSVGCDSIATLQLTVVQTIIGPVDSTTVCANALPIIWNGINITAAGTYKATLQSAAGCDSVATLVVSTQPIATATVSGGNPICLGQSTTISIALTGVAPWTLVYSDGNGSHTIKGIMSSPFVLTVSPTTTTTYSLTSVSDLKCSNTNLSSSVTVTVIQSVQGVRYPNVNATANVPKQLSARDLGNDYKYNWSPPDGLNQTDVRTPIFKYDRSVQYLITLTPTNGCKVVDTVRVLIASSAFLRSSLHVPNAWSPNTDGHNDKLFPLTINIKELYYFRVFNRWGQLMFETNKLGEGWDGVFNGKPQIQDVYTWTVEAIGLDGVYYKQSGNSILLR
jgi:gliding motility-associated-like protein